MAEKKYILTNSQKRINDLGQTVETLSSIIVDLLSTNASLLSTNESLESRIAKLETTLNGISETNFTAIIPEPNGRISRYSIVGTIAELSVRKCKRCGRGRYQKVIDLFEEDPSRNSLHYYQCLANHKDSGGYHCVFD